MSWEWQESNTSGQLQNDETVHLNASLIHEQRNNEHVVAR
jgi:hypothetical protein